MAYEKTIVCLANSRKHKGQCFAGKEIRKNKVGGWIRPVSDREGEEISKRESAYENNKQPTLLDKISIAFVEHRPNHHQTENHLIDDKVYWVKEGKFDSNDLHELIDQVDGALWVNGFSSSNGQNDRVRSSRAEKFEHSLVLISPNELRVTVGEEPGWYGSSKKKVRAEFTVNSSDYCLAVTDQAIERRFMRRGEGEYLLQSEDHLLCVSLAEPWRGYCYKLVASIIEC